MEIKTLEAIEVISHMGDGEVSVLHIGDDQDDLSVISNGDCGGMCSCATYCSKAQGHSGKHFCPSCKKEF